MADQKYWGRSATGKRSLPDIEVARLMTERRGRRDDFVEKLTSLKLGSLPGLVERQHGHLYVMADPAVGLTGPSLTDAATGQHQGCLIWPHYHTLAHDRRQVSPHQVNIKNHDATLGRPRNSRPAP